MSLDGWKTDWQLTRGSRTRRQAGAGNLTLHHDRRATEVVAGGYGPELVGKAENDDEIYHFSIGDMNMVGCNLGVGRNDDGSLSAGYGTSHGDDLLLETYSRSLGSPYFADPSSHFDK